MIIKTIFGQTYYVVAQYKKCNIWAGITSLDFWITGEGIGSIPQWADSIKDAKETIAFLRG